MRFLEDEMLAFRAVEPEDAQMMWCVETDSTQWRENGMMAPYSMRNIREYAENYDADPIRSGQLRLIAETREKAGSREDKFAGIADLFDISPTGRTAFVGLYVRQQFRGRGYASHMLRLLEEYCRMLLNLRILAGKVSETNIASRAMFERAGYSREAELHGWLLSGPETHSLLIYTKPLITTTSPLL